MHTEPLGRSLLIIARNAIHQHLGQGQQAFEPYPELQRPAATFVTLTQSGQLRGCIGSLEALRELATDIHANAQAAAFRDPRFAPLVEDELPRTRIEVSLLGPAEALDYADENEALRQLRPGIDGLILCHDSRRSTFLPQVWESLPLARDFLCQLKRKAGLPENFWDDNILLSRYRVDKWKEQ